MTLEQTIEQLKKQLEGANSAFDDVHASYCEDVKCPYCIQYRQDWTEAR